ncbi:interferon-induced very large GTPase 1-like [Trachemys scripta elegans]|uniref:interferon-induced very large GTPase 1-like n=1 Tax=Trachemys scripta elegans TaxID=31138 RepID=UPI0015554195|nr:interferon-induced very large GTPase 1-like [Trachemys scripta elegans]
MLRVVWFPVLLGCVTAGSESSDKSNIHSRVGEDVTLSCRFKLSSDFVLNRLRIHWHVFRDEEGSVVHSYYDGADRLEDQEVEFKGRTKLFLQELSEGVASLNLTQVRPSDSGEYRCIIVNSQDVVIGSVILHVSAPYEPPQVTLLSWEEGEMTLQCKSRGGYPKAEITWHDGNGNQLNQSEPAELRRGSEGVFEVQSRLVVTGPEDSTFCCSLIHAPFNQNLSVCERVKALVRENKTEAESSGRSNAWIFAIVGVVVTVVAGVGVYMYRRRRRSSQKDTPACYSAEDEVRLQTDCNAPRDQHGAETDVLLEREHGAPREHYSEEDEVSLQNEAEGKGKSLQDFLVHLGLERHQSRKLKLNDILEIKTETLEESNPRTLGEIPWHFLRKVMAVNGMARRTRLGPAAPGDNGIRKDGEKPFAIIPPRSPAPSVCVNPLDVLCAVLCCSDTFLRQEILLKMSMCQFALPLLLPALGTSTCTLLLWAMRDIVKNWRPLSLRESRGFREENLVLTSVPTFSFVRLGRCSLSKSKILNKVLSPPQQQHDFFIHRDMESGNVPREIAEGLVEISWYFPGGRESSDPFQEPIAVINLRGDIESHRLQFSFLAEISSAVFIFTECISERKYELLSSLQDLRPKLYLILNPSSTITRKTQGFLNELVPLLKLTQSHVLVKDNTANDSDFVTRLQDTLAHLTKQPQRAVSIEDMAVTARERGIQVDEDCEECAEARKRADKITGEIEDVGEYKGRALTLQGVPCKRLAEVERELCQMKKQGETPTEDYKSQLRRELLELRTQQNGRDLTGGMGTFKASLEQLTPVETHYFLKWMKFRLDHIARENLSKLRAKYKETYRTPGHSPEQLAKLDELIAASSLGVEHFMRELGQFYEAEHSVCKDSEITQSQRRFTHLPGIAADLMLSGFALEIIDGDASHVPLQWVTDVLTKLHDKLGGKSRLLVLSVLGVQSTGKSTLLNTMFGLQLAVSSSRCTRGAFMTLIKVAEKFQQELGCDFILVIDAEGLRAPQLAKLEDSYEHDNELATLVIGLSDITIVNMAMENTSEMKDILQIVVHAFLRMKEIGHKPNCQFVYQNISDVSAHEQNMRDRNHFLEHLNEMTKAAARMEKLSRDLTFSDIMAYDPEKHNWYIPGLWQGVPPMAPVNLGYSESVYELKKYLLDFMRSRTPNRTPRDIPLFTKWVKNLWNAVKHENFIFSFRNSLVAEAYNQLCLRYSEWEWELRKEMHLWVCDQETAIQNQPCNELPDAGNLKQEAQEKVQKGEERIVKCLQRYFESRARNRYLIEKYREDFIRSTKRLKTELERYSASKCEKAILIKKSWHKIDNIQAEYMRMTEKKVVSLLEDCKRRKLKLEKKELEVEFETMWKEAVSELKLISLKRRQVSQDLEFQLRKDLENRGSTVRQKLQEAGNLCSYRIKSFTMDNDYLDLTCFRDMRESVTQEYRHKAEEFARSLMDKCHRYIKEKVNSKVDYDETYGRELLQMINERLQQEDVPNLHINACFEVDLKLHILGEAAHAFQEMHENFIKENDPQERLEKLKPQYLSTFMNHYLEKDPCQQRARHFCEHCLKPALAEHVNKKLGIRIVDDLSRSEKANGYRNRACFQLSVLQKLLDEMDFDNYKKYINDYESFVKAAIWRDILDHYGNRESIEALEAGILSAIIEKVRGALEMSIDGGTSTVSDFVANVCRLLQKDLVLPRDSLETTLFQFTASADTSQFSADIQDSLSELEQNLASEFKAVNIEEKLSKLQVKPQDELFKRVFGCGKRCPFCGVPCEAEGSVHTEHSAPVHRPRGLRRRRDHLTETLDYSLCSSDVVSNASFSNSDTKGKLVPFRDYRLHYPDWRIQPDPSSEASNYWKFVFKEFNCQFASEYKAKPADLPEDWGKITKEQALESIKGIYSRDDQHEPEKEPEFTSVHCQRDT